MAVETKPELNLTLASQIVLDDATPMMRQFLEVKQAYPGVILFYRMGDFYETFFEDALITARALEITLTGRESGKLGRIPMAGVPVKAVDGYLQRLLEKNFKVAICEQMEDPAQAKGLVERRVTRVLSSGTVADQRFLKPTENNFLAAVVSLNKEGLWGLAYCDVTTGEFYATELTEMQFYSELDRIGAREVLVLGKKQKGVVVDEWVPAVDLQLAQTAPCTPLRPEAFNPVRGQEAILKWFSVNQTDSFGISPGSPAMGAVGAILAYLEHTYVEEARPVFETIRFYRLSEQLEINSAARRHLEITQTVKDGRPEGSLFWVMNKTKTAMGARLLRQWLQTPSVDLNEINSRLDAVEVLVNAPILRESLQEILPQIYDLERLAARVQNLSAMPRDLMALKLSCDQLPKLARILADQSTFYLARAQSMPPEVSVFASLIEDALLENPPLTLKEGGIFKAGYHEELDSLRYLLETQQSWLENYERTERERSGIKTLKVSMNNAFGYYIEITKSLAKQAPIDYQRKQTLTNAERYITPELKAHEDQVFDAQNRLFDLEYQLYLSFREKLSIYGALLKDVSHRVACLDALASLANVAVENSYIRPQVDNSLELTLHGARHPVIEKILPMGTFVSNDCALSADYGDHRLPQLMIITGPNMAGKSTYMRQTALIILMAQMGSFVPCTYARIGLVDQLFTRIGAVDDLSSGQSTFMVEMNETAQILNCATERSFVLLDEVGRGTSTYDGVAIAWSVAEHLVQQTYARTLFATHYHELNTLEEAHPKIANFRVLVSETEGHIEFLHQVVPGTAQKSYGIQVAKMAGIPPSVIQKAERLLSKMQEKEYAAIEKRRQSDLLEAAKQQSQMTLFNVL